MLNITPLVRLYGSRRLRKLAAMDAVDVQQRQLLGLVARATRTKFGRDHDFKSIRSITEFQARVPLRRYEDFQERYWGPAFPDLRGVSWPSRIPYLAVTSGTTTGRTKYIPCTNEIISSNTMAGLDLVCHHLARRPDSKVLGGKSFMLGGSTEFTQEAPGIRSGDLSGIMTESLPWWFQGRSFPSRDDALVSDWELKVDRMVRALDREDIRLIGGTPSWLLIFFDMLAAYRGDSSPDLAKYFPNLELLIHGGVDFQPYRARFESLIADTHAELREVYPASEGFIGVADRGPDDGLRLMLDTGLFYEFVPVDELESRRPTRHWAGSVQRGINYALVVSSCAGLWSYVIGDTVELVSRDPLRVKVTGRTSYSMSAFGEHLIAEEIEAAVRDGGVAIGSDVRDWSVGAVHASDDDSRGGHLYIVEFAGEVPSAARLAHFARILDAALCATNEDYEAHRADGFGMNAPEVVALPPGGFPEWMKARGQLGGQHKVPRIINDAELFESLRRFAADRA
ncbi:MAG: GH3 auxin-responsive promoter family protein [Alphaproteobacteria bacterium]